jgi:thiamine biosynthesis lipoprotein
VLNKLSIKVTPVANTYGSLCDLSHLRVACSFLLILAVVGCSRPGTYQQDFFAFGTLVEVTFYGANRPLADKAFEAARKQFNTMTTVWHAWRPSAVTRANALIAADKSSALRPELLYLIKRAKRLSKQSGGLFNPAIGRLIALWGFHSDDYGGRRPPTAIKIKALVEKYPSMRDLVVKGTRLSSTNRYVQLDFGAFAKGYGVGRVVNHLHKMGIENLIVNAGGDLRATGDHGNRPWRIGIQNPRGDGVIASVEIHHDESVFTSGDYERYFVFKGKRYHHILDPRTGYPARGVTSATVIDADSGTADAAATALLVAGPNHWISIARAMRVRDVLLIDSHGRAHMTPSMFKRIHFEIDPPPPTIVSIAP